MGKGGKNRSKDLRFLIENDLRYTRFLRRIDSPTRAAITGVSISTRSLGK